MKHFCSILSLVKIGHLLISCTGEPNNYVVVTYPSGLPSGIYNKTIANYSRLRDYYNRPNGLNKMRWYLPTLVLVSMVAKYANFTVIEEGEICKLTLCGQAGVSKLPWIWPAVRTLDSSYVKMTVFSAWNQFYDSQLVASPNKFFYFWESESRTANYFSSKV